MIEHNPVVASQNVVSHRKMSSAIKRREVREYYSQYYPRQNQQQIANHFGISVRTLQRYIEDE